MIKCANCQVEKEFWCFHHKEDSANGRVKKCIECVNRLRRLGDEKERARKRAWYAKTHPNHRTYTLRTPTKDELLV